MGRLVQVSKAGANNVQLPNGLPYNVGDHVVLTNEEWAVINPASFGADAILTDRGSYNVANPTIAGAPVPTLGSENLLNSDTVQVGNSAAPARTNLSRRTSLRDVAAVANSQVVFVPVILHDGDVITNIQAKVGNTAAGTPTNGFFALYSPTGALLVQTATFGTTARPAYSTVLAPLTAPYTVPPNGGGVFFVGIGFTATAVPSFLSHVYSTAGGGGQTALSGMAPLARTSVGGAYTTTAPATIAGATGLAASVNAPHVVLT